MPSINKQYTTLIREDHLDDLFDRARRLGIKINDPRYERACELESLLSDLLNARHSAEQAGQSTMTIGGLIDETEQEIKELWSKNQ